ncbi:MAG: M20/M25/M40 family metallo-hydrolase [Candidatus Odinarchaeia archaeon]
MDEVDFLEKMISIYSPHGHEEAMTAFLKDSMQKMGFKVSVSEVGNVIGEVGNGAPIILLCGHMDTIEGELPVKREDGRIYGRGAVDAKAPLAAMILAARKFIDDPNFNGKIVVAAVVDEEGHSKGARDLVKKRIKFNYGIFGEPSNSKFITIGYKGSLSFTLEFKTMGGHTANPLIDNAIDNAIEFWGILKDAFKKYQGKTVKSSIIATISGIESEDVRRCSIKLNIRIPKRDDVEIVKNELQNLVKDFEANRNVTIEAILKEVILPYEANKRSKLIEALRKAIIDVWGEAPRLIKKTGTGDMNIFGEVYDEPLVTYGPGDSRLDHTDMEFIEIDEFLKSIEVYGKCIKYLIE